MSNNHKLRRPATGERLKVRVLADDPWVREQLRVALTTETVDVVDDGDAHVALFDLGSSGRSVASAGLHLADKSAHPTAKGPSALAGRNRATERADRARLELALAGLDAAALPTVVLAEDESQARAALARGASGVVARSLDPLRLTAALHAVAAGLNVLDFAFSTRPPHVEEAAPAALTVREQEVLELLTAGCSNRRIARKLGISQHTAKFHVNGILVKLGAGSRTEAVVAAARRGLVTL